MSRRVLIKGEISINQFWREFGRLKEGDALIFTFPDKKEKRTFLRVESKNMITKRDGVKVWLGKPKIENHILKEGTQYTIKNYLCDGGDLIISIGGML